MTTRDDFTDAEWEIVTRAPVAMISGVIGVSPGGPVELAQEVGAAVKSFETAARTQADNPLIAAVLVTLKAGFETYLGKKDDKNDSISGNMLDLAKNPATVIEHCRQLTDLLSQKAEPAESDEFRRWLFSVAEAVAHAANEGGFLGMGGERVNEQERTMLCDIAAALQVPAA